MGMSYGGMGGGSMDMGGMGPEEMGAFAKLMQGLPEWAVAVITTLLVIIGGAIIGVNIGKMYSAIKYPDPEKHSIIPPTVKVGFICVIAACSVWLYTTLTAPPVDDSLAVGGDEMTGEMGEDNSGDSSGSKHPSGGNVVISGGLDTQIAVFG